MSDMIQFVQNYDDLSTDRGFQFRFKCDKCGNGYLSPFETSTLGVAAGLLRAAGNLFGSSLGSASNSAYEIQRAIGGKAHDDALKNAVQAGKQHFRQCSRCGRWVCPEVCWNARANLCEGCAPDEHEELSAAKSQAAASQIHQKAQAQDYTADLDFSKGGMVMCTKCGAKMSANTRFCAECGTQNLSAAGNKPKFCTGCGNTLEPGARFCPGCGAKA